MNLHIIKMISLYKVESLICFLISCQQIKMTTYKVLTLILVNNCVTTTAMKNISFH